jgi:penicillin amidase
VPHVYAANEHDLFLAQGYLHAQERLWQMEMSRRFLSGSMAEIFGDFALPWKELSSQFRGRTSIEFDYFVRLLGIRDAAVASLAHLAEAEQLRLTAYSTGVNAYIERCGKKLPWEFRVLRHEPEPWRPVDTVTINKGLAFLLSTALYTRLNWLAIAAQLQDSPEKLRMLMPNYPDDAPTTTRLTWDQARGLWEFASGILAGSPWHPAGHGSNSWAIAPHRSSSGSAVLCNDPHLRTTLPSTWYLMSLKAAGDPTQPDIYEASGASIPGMPGILLGHNRSIAWGITAAVCDDVEIYREKLHPVEPEIYQTPDGWEKLVVRRESFGVRGKPAVEKIIRWSRHGPVISDFCGGQARSEILAVRWTAHEPSQELRSAYEVNRARNWQEFRDALRFHSAPSLNFVYADRDGNIGYSLAGKIPKRNQTPTLMPVEGWQNKNEWSGYIPFEELPQMYRPPEGVIVSANNRIANSAYPHYLSHFFEPPHRIRRIEQLLAERQKHSTDDLAAMQLDVISLHAKEFVEMLKPELDRLADDDPAIKIAAQRLLVWDGNCSADSIEATIFHVLHHRLLFNLLSPDLGEQLFAAYVEILNQCIVPTDRIYSDPKCIWFTYHSRPTLVRNSLREACDGIKAALGSNMENWRWGRIHQLQMNHSLGRSKWLKPLLGIGPIGAPGDGMTINLGFYRHSNPYSQTVGAALRFIAELNDRCDSGFILPSGQSGHPLSRNYRDLTERWLRGERINLSLDTTELSRLSHLLLKPV